LPMNGQSHLRVSLVATLLTLGHGNAHAEPLDGAAVGSMRQAMSTHFAVGDYQKAEGVLLGTLRSCGERCSANVRARIWLYVGTVRVARNTNPKSSMEAFGNGLALDPSVEMDRNYADARALKLFADANRSNAKPHAKPSEPENRASATDQCLPPCRDTYVCVLGKCVSECNPPCSANETCVSGGHCVPATASITPNATATNPLATSNVGAGPEPATTNPGQVQPLPTPAAVVLTLPPPTIQPELPDELPYRAGMQVPPGYHLVTYRAKGLIIPGIATFATAYAVAFVMGTTSSYPGARWLTLPLIGPWIGLAANGCTGCESKPMPFVGTGLPQAIGAGLFLLGERRSWSVTTQLRCKSCRGSAANTTSKVWHWLVRSRDCMRNSAHE
jgi:hypothetical protein